MSDEGEIENEIINYSVNRENKYNQPGNERTALRDVDSRISDSSKSGNEGNFSLLWIILAAVTEIIIEINFYKHFPYTIQH